MNPELMSDLVWKAQMNDADAMEQLLLEAYTPVSYLTFRILQDEETACQITREVLEIIHTKISSLHETDQFQKWMCRITAARCIQVMPLYHHSTAAMEPTPLDLPENGTELTEDQSALLIQQITDRLPEKQRLCLILLGCGGLGIHAISQLIGFSTETVSESIQKAQSAIQKQIWELENRNIQLTGLSSLTGILQKAMFRKDPQNDPIPMVYGILGKEIPVPPDPEKAIIRTLTVVLVILSVAVLVTGGILAMKLLS